MNIYNNKINICITEEELENSKFLKTLLSMCIYDGDVSQETLHVVSQETLDTVSQNKKDEGKEINRKINIFEKQDTEDDSFIFRNRIPNTTKFLDNKFSKSILDEHFNNTGKKVSLEDLNVEQDEITIINDFACPNCYQGSIAFVNKEYEELLDGQKFLFNIVDKEKHIMCVLSSKIMEDFNDDDNIIDFIYQSLISDNSGIDKSEIVLKVTDNILEKLTFGCPVCDSTYKAIDWVIEAEESSAENKCRYCGHDRFINVETGEMECSNKHCYTNKVL